jgi:predicted GIY-YIG superfamily endonuclease
MVDLDSIDGYPEKVNRYDEEKTYVYILRLFSERWYIGVTEAPKRRIIGHAGKMGIGTTDWTKQYPPVEIAEVLAFDSSERAYQRESEIAEAFAHYYGRGRVRGGSIK